jgi:flavin-binding protein dodecin
MLFWYAYRLDYQLSGAAPGQIAPGCKGSASGGGCNFDQFLKHIQQGNTQVGADLEPETYATAQKLQSEGYSNLFDANKLFPNDFAASTTTYNGPKFNDVVLKVVDRIQVCRDSLGDETIQDQLDEARKAMHMVHAARVADQAATQIKGVNEWLSQRKQKYVNDTKPSCPFSLYQALIFFFSLQTVETKSMEFLARQDFLMVDTEATIAKNPGLTGQLADDFKTYVENYVTSNGPRRSKFHLPIVQFCQAQSARLLGTKCP